MVDAYTEDEQEVSFSVMLEEHVRVPFPARVVGEDVQVEGFDFADHGQGVVAKVRRRGRRYRVNVLELEVPDPHPPGLEWIDAYRLWATGKVTP